MHLLISLAGLAGFFSALALASIALHFAPALRSTICAPVVVVLPDEGIRREASIQRREGKCANF